MRMVEDPWLFIWHLHLVLTCMHFLTWVSSYGWIGGRGPESVAVSVAQQTPSSWGLAAVGPACQSALSAVGGRWCFVLLLAVDTGICPVGASGVNTMLLQWHAFPM